MLLAKRFLIECDRDALGLFKQSLVDLKEKRAVSGIVFEWDVVHRRLSRRMSETIFWWDDFCAQHD